MKELVRIVSALLMGIMLLAGCLWLLNTAQAARPGWLPSSDWGAVEPKPILVDDFDDGNLENKLGGNGSCWAWEGLITCTVLVTDNNGFLQMEYGVTRTDAYALYSSELLSANLTALDTVWVAVRGAQGAEPVVIELKDCDQSGVSHYSKELISDHLPRGITSSELSGVAIPLAEFDEITDWSCIDRLNIMASSAISSGEGKIYVDDIRLLPSRVVVDDFHDTERKNELGGDSGRWTYGSVITYVYSNGALKFSYQVPPGATGGSYWTKLISTNLLSRKDNLFFDIRGEQGGEEVLVEFKDCGLNGEPHYPKIAVSDYLIGGITTTWRTVAMPLAAFVDEQNPSDPGTDWRCIEEMSFLVNGQPPIGGGEGTVYIDNIRLVPADGHPVPVLVDSFQDCNEWDALNWKWYTHNEGTGQFSAAFDPVNTRDGNGCSYHFTFRLADSDWAYAYAELKGLDASDYADLEFYIKGRQGENGTATTRVYLRDRAGNQRIMPIEPTDNWRRVLIPLRYFSSVVDLTDLAEVKFAYEGGFRDGEVYIDDVSFTTLDTHLPIVLNNYRGSCQDYKPGCPSPYNNYEPNNYMCSTTFELSSGVPIQSYICAPDDRSDYYRINVTALSPITIRLTGIPYGVDYDLYLYRDNDIVATSNRYGHADEAFTYAPAETGEYYIRVNPYSGYSLSPYTLRADFQ
jgi:hypothetical protein